MSDNIPVHFEHDLPSDAMFPPAILADIACAHEMLKKVKGERYWMKLGRRWKSIDQFTYDTLSECAVDVTLARIEA